MFEGSLDTQKGNTEYFLPPLTSRHQTIFQNDQKLAAGMKEEDDKTKVLTEVTFRLLLSPLTSPLGLRCSEEREGGDAGTEQKQTGK